MIEVPTEEVNRHLTVIARDATEMATAQAGLLAWVDGKIKEETDDLTDFRANLETAKAHKWKSSGFVRGVTKCEKRLSYYSKVKAALEAGYVIVPSFPCDIIAVRTDRERPLRMETRYRTRHQQKSQDLPIGEGEYRPPIPLAKVSEYTITEGGKQVVKENHWADRWDDFDFPTKAIKPQILDDSTRAMSMRIFDEIGFVHPNVGRHQDPMIIGQVVYRDGYNERRVSFMVAWWLSTADIEL